MLLDQARRGTLAGIVRTGAKFAEAAEEWLRYVEHDRDCKPSTLSDYSLSSPAICPGVRRPAGRADHAGADRAWRARWRSGTSP